MTTQMDPAAQPNWTSVEDADDRALRNLFGTFLTGVTIVTLRDADGLPRGFTANSFTSVSLDPPLILVCVANSASSYASLCETERFAVNILGDGQRHASNAFASRTGRKFADVPTRSTADGPPFVESSLSAMECIRELVVPAGDHAIVIGRVIGFRMGSGQPLGYYRGGYVAFALGADALEHLGGVALRIGCLLECEERVLLVKRQGADSWELPSVPLRAGEDDRQLLPRLLGRFEISANVDFLYSVYQDEGGTSHHADFPRRGRKRSSGRRITGRLEDVSVFGKGAALGSARKPISADRAPPVFQRAGSGEIRDLLGHRRRRPRCGPGGLPATLAEGRGHLSFAHEQQARIRVSQARMSQH